MTFNEFKSDLARRCRETKTTRWWRFGVVASLYLLWCLWMHNAWLLLGLILLFDIYIAGYIPFTWWKKSKNKAVRVVMGWVDAIVYALILVYFIFNFVGQNYQIPSSSLEKTLLTGDYLFVNKLTYGPRVPMTPVHFPLVHNKMPLIGTDSYLDSPSNSYHRLAGLRNVEAGDIVVFNFPAGDTVTTVYEESPVYYYELIKEVGFEYLMQNRNSLSRLIPESLMDVPDSLVYVMIVDDEGNPRRAVSDEMKLYAEAFYHSDVVKDAGRSIVASNPETFGEVRYRPVDRRTNFVKRAVGLPGQRLKIVNNVVYIDGVPYTQPENVQFNYTITTSRVLNDDDLEKYGIALVDLHQSGPNRYFVPLTYGMITQMRADGLILDYELSPTTVFLPGSLFPEGISEGWTLGDYGGSAGIWIPKKGATLRLTPEEWPIYERAIRNYEGHTNSYVKDGQVYVDGKPADTYTFQLDYYFMMGDNRDNSQDSRFWGFVPEDHIIGTPMFVFISFDKDRGLFNGGVRWNRIFRDANPDK